MADPDAPLDPEHLEPVDVDGVRAVATGTVVWAVLLAVSLLLRGPLEAADHGWWWGVCLAGFLLGVLGLWFVRRRRDRIAARAARASG